MFKSYLFLIIGIFLLSACIHTNRLNHKLANQIRKDSILSSAHCGVAVWDTKKEKYVIQYQSDQYFVPASNVKIVTLYAAMKYLPDSLPSFEYYNRGDTIFIIPKGDPTFLDSEIANQQTIDFLKKLRKPLVILPVKWETEIYGKGWAWDDYANTYMPEKSPMPVKKKFTKNNLPGEQIVFPSIQNITDSTAHMLSDSIGLPVISANTQRKFDEQPQIFSASLRDSALKKMMFLSDNLIAEQLLLMVSEKLSGNMNESKLIENLLSDTAFHFPQKPVWVDGSGLSRYNLFTPEDLVYVLKKLENEFGSNKIRKIFPTGNEGTLKGYYDNKSGLIYAKTGTLSGQVTLSGYLKTKKNNSVIFSFMVNNHASKSTQVRKIVAEYIDWIWSAY